ncbi:hypothetical protein RI367_001468 [Sorochytrium milnesiophthora]
MRHTFSHPEMPDTPSTPSGARTALSNSEIKRYGRQLILPELGISGTNPPFGCNTTHTLTLSTRSGQIKLATSSVLVVGAGGLGSPVLLYLAAAGVGTLGIVDYDVVAQSNLHRQIIHGEHTVGTSKVASACAAVSNVNEHVVCRAHDTALTSSNAMDIVGGYNVVVDASDNVATRYLLNDVCVLLDKPLVSGSALRFEGQLTVYNFHGGPCYRCLFPRPPPPDAVTNCDDGGVMGPITGVIGSMQALEVVKIIAMDQSSYTQRMLMYDGLGGTVRTIKLRPRQPTCAVCGDTPTITQPIDYVQFCGSGVEDKTRPLTVLGAEERVPPSVYASLREATRHILLDVRDAVQFQICALPGAINVPLRDLEKRMDEVRALVADGSVPVYAVCRRGNFSQLAVQSLRQHGLSNAFDIERGLEGWQADVDGDFPVY